MLVHVPIKRGTARRLGLRPWWPRIEPPRDVTLSDEEVAEFKRRFEDALRTGSVRWIRP